MSSVQGTGAVKTGNKRRNYVPQKMKKKNKKKKNKKKKKN